MDLSNRGGSIPVTHTAVVTKIADIKIRGRALRRPPNVTGSTFRLCLQDHGELLGPQKACRKPQKAISMKLPRTTLPMLQMRKTEARERGACLRPPSALSAEAKLKLGTPTLAALHWNQGLPSCAAVRSPLKSVAAEVVKTPSRATHPATGEAFPTRCRSHAQTERKAALFTQQQKRQ